MAGYRWTKAAAGEAWGRDSSDLLRRQNEALVRLLEYAGVEVPEHLAGAPAAGGDGESRRFEVLKRLLEDDVLSELEEPRARSKA